jgi:DNA-binding NarL/FixJ family response regulator
MNILVVEDDDFKFEEIDALIKYILPQCGIVRHETVYGAVNYLTSYSPDKVILDMSLPSHPAKPGEGTPLSMPSGGMEIILELKYLGKSSLPIIVLTQFSHVEVEHEYCTMSQAETKIKELYSMENIIIQAYEKGLSEWKDATTKFLRD